MRWPRAAPRALAPLRHRGFRLLMTGQVTSNLGDACYAVALPWYVLATHGGAVLLGTVLAAYGIPRTALLAIGGYACDRWGAQTVMMTADVTRALAVAALAVTAALGPASPAGLIPIAVVLGAGEGFFLPGSFAIIPSLLPGEDLQAGNALSSSGTQLATLAGPAIGGALVALLGPAPAFGLDAASFAVSVATLAAIRVSRRASPAAATGTGDAVPDARPSLLALVRSQRVLLIILLTTVAGNLGPGGESEVALPALAHGPLHVGAPGYGAIVAAFGGGALLGTIIAAQAPRLRRPAITASLVFLVQAATSAAIPFLGTTATVATAMAVGGMMNGFGNVVMITAFQRWAPPDLMGRLSGLLTLSAFGVFPVSAALAAFFTRDLGPGSFFWFSAATLAAALLAGLSTRSWRDFGAAREMGTSLSA
ncbi:MAG: MFS transporter [Nocardiopsaceae bacterium]|nr:MFS transporter [Nocardiopsaceae bacterium]